MFLSLCCVRHITQRSELCLSQRDVLETRVPYANCFNLDLFLHSFVSVARQTSPKKHVTLPQQSVLYSQFITTRYFLSIPPLLA